MRDLSTGRGQAPASATTAAGLSPGAAFALGVGLSIGAGAGGSARLSWIATAAPAHRGMAVRPRAGRGVVCRGSAGVLGRVGTVPAAWPARSGVYYWVDQESASRGGGQMAAKDGIGRASEAARAARRNRYVQRLIEDEDLRQNIIAAYAAARGAYGRMHNGKPASKALFEDRKLQRELAQAAKALREASATLSEKPKSKRRKGGLGRAVLLLLVGGALALAVSESLRSKVLDLLFGAEEEFDYSSTTAPAAPAPAEAPAEDVSASAS